MTFISFLQLIWWRLRDLSVSEGWKLRWYIGTYVDCVCRQVCCTNDDEPSSRGHWTFCLELSLSEFLTSNARTVSFVNFLLPGEFDWSIEILRPFPWSFMTFSQYTRHATNLQLFNLQTNWTLSCYAVWVFRLLLAVLLIDEADTSDIKDAHAWMCRI